MAGIVTMWCDWLRYGSRGLVGSVAARSGSVRHGKDWQLGYGMGRIGMQW